MSPQGVDVQYLIKIDSAVAALRMREKTLFRVGFFGRPFVKRFALCYQTVVCLSCLSETFVRCCQTVGRIKIKLDRQVGLGL